MAELALGGIERAIRPRTRSGECRHETALSVTAAGVERSICETCGHIGVRFLTEMEGPVFRNLFARPADLAVESPMTNPFSEEPRFGVSRRAHPGPESLLLSA